MKIEFTLNKECRKFESLDWYIIQTVSNYYGGISYVDGVGYWMNGQDLVKDHNRYYTVYTDDIDVYEVFYPMLHYVKGVSGELSLLLVVDGVHSFL